MDLIDHISSTGFPGALVVKNPPADAGDLGSSLCWEHPLEKGMATHSSILACRIPWTEEPGGPQSRGLSQTAGQYWAQQQLAQDVD